MNEQKAEKEITEGLLQEPTVIAITRENPSLFHKILTLFGWKRALARRFTISPLVLGTKLRIASLIAEMNFGNLDGLEASEDGKTLRLKFRDNDSIIRVGLQNIRDNTDLLIRVIALYLTNSRKEPSRRLEKFLRWNIAQADMINLFNRVLPALQLNFFLSCLVSLQGEMILNGKD